MLNRLLNDDLPRLRGVKPDLRHATSSCQAIGLDYEHCTCSPTVRWFIREAWRLPSKLPKGWGRREFAAAFTAAVEEKNRLERGERPTLVRIRNSPTLQEWMPRCLEIIKAPIDREDPSAYSPLTYKSYGAIAGLVKTRPIAKKRLANITTDDIDELRLALLAEGYAPSYVKQVIWTLAGMFNVAQDQKDQIAPAENPARVPRARHYGRREKSEPPDDGPSKFRPDLVRELLGRHWGTQLGTMILLGATTGMRQRELAGACIEHLRFSDARFDVRVQLDHQRLRRPKYESERPVPLVSALAHLWAPLDGGKGFLFLDPETGLPFMEDSLRKLFNRAWEAVEPRPRGHSWHVLRHTFSTVLERAGVRPLVNAYVMGHRSHGSRGGVSGVYQHVPPEDLDVVLEVVEAAYPVVRGTRVAAVPRFPSAGRSHTLRG